MSQIIDISAFAAVSLESQAKRLDRSQCALEDLKHKGAMTDKALDPNLPEAA